MFKQLFNKWKKSHETIKLLTGIYGTNIVITPINLYLYKNSDIPKKELILMSIISGSSMLLYMKLMEKNNYLINNLFT
jgi:hypothetical protein